MRNRNLAIAVISGLMLANCALAQSVQCILNLTKETGWENYDVTITMNNPQTHKVLGSYLLAKASANTPAITKLSQPFDCSNLQQISFSATFAPPIWQNDAGKVYPSSLIVDVAGQLASIPTTANTLTISVAFPDDFVDVPGLLNSGS